MIGGVFNDYMYRGSVIIDLSLEVKLIARNLSFVRRPRDLQPGWFLVRIIKFIRPPCRVLFSITVSHMNCDAVLARHHFDPIELKEVCGMKHKSMELLFELPAVRIIIAKKIGAEFAFDTINILLVECHPHSIPLLVFIYAGRIGNIKCDSLNVTAVKTFNLNSWLGNNEICRTRYDYPGPYADSCKWHQ